MKSKGVSIYIHIGSWLLFLLFIGAFVFDKENFSNSGIPIILLPSFLFFALFFAVLFYVNMYVLMPYFFLKKRYFAFSCIVIVLFVACFYLKPFERIVQEAHKMHANQLEGKLENGLQNLDIQRRSDSPPFRSVERGRPKPPSPLRFDLISLVLFLMAMAGSGLIVLVAQWRITEKNKSLIETQKVKAELAFLKSQISPHFLFNTLNNIYALAIAKSENTASGILWLSNMMRYITDKSEEDYVPVEREIACIKDYIELQKLRLGKNVKIEFSLKGNYENTKVAPLILMSFIENTFKHGVSNIIPSQIVINILIIDREIILETRNTINKMNGESSRNGIGLQNAKQRLELLYPDKHHLQISESDGMYSVFLTLRHFQPLKQTQK